MQLMLVRSCVGLGLELLRLVPCTIAALRRLGPGLTPKEREAPWLGLSPLSEPGELAHAAALSDAVLMFVILFAYAALSPVTCFVMAFCFGTAAVVYRNQARTGPSGPHLQRAIPACPVHLFRTRLQDMITVAKPFRA